MNQPQFHAVSNDVSASSKGEGGKGGNVKALDSYRGKRHLTCSGEIQKNKMIKNIIKRQVFFHLAEFQNGIFCFVFGKTSSSLPMQLVVIFSCRKTFKLTYSKRKNSEVAVHRCSSKQLFLKIQQYCQENNCLGVSLQ